MARLKRILDRARQLDMVPIVNYFYQGGQDRIREDALSAAVDNATFWLLEQGYDGLIIDVVNECDIARYRPALHLSGVHELVYRVKDDVDLFSARLGQSRRFFVGASFTGRFSQAEQLINLPTQFIQAVDLLMPHGNLRTSSQMRDAIIALRERVVQVTSRVLPIVYNEDIQTSPESEGADNGGDLAHLGVCLDAHVSWGNLIRSHQRVPCEDWVQGSDVQREWFDRASALAGQAAPPSSNLHLFHRM